MEQKSIALTDEQWEALGKRAKNLGISVSEMLRWIVEAWRKKESS